MTSMTLSLMLMYEGLVTSNETIHAFLYLRHAEAMA